MAICDAGGMILIDEVEAQNDINNLNKSNESLKEALEVMNTINIQAEEFEGNVGKALSENAVEFKNKITALIQEVEESVRLIQQTVAKYQQIDTSLKEQILNENN
ncbi:MAG: hypothetical protein ACI39R_06835 [Lachnospiraceae bacterium]